MTGRLRFGWEVAGAGWVVCRVSDGVSEWKGVVGYLTDALADTLRAVVGLYGATGVQRISFDLEPAEARWRLRRQGADVSVEVRQFPDMTTSWDAPDDAGTLVWSATRPLGELAHAVLEAAEEVLRTHGEAGYLSEWGAHPFPLAALRELRRLHRGNDACPALELDPGDRVREGVEEAVHVGRDGAGRQEEPEEGGHDRGARLDVVAADQHHQDDRQQNHHRQRNGHY
ncbi:hypothetical protein ABIC27_001661 [Streptomyces sp. PvR034]